MKVCHRNWSLQQFSRSRNLKPPPFFLNRYRNIDESMNNMELQQPGLVIQRILLMLAFTSCHDTSLRRHPQHYLHR